MRWTQVVKRISTDDVNLTLAEAIDYAFLDIPPGSGLSNGEAWDQLFEVLVQKLPADFKELFNPDDATEQDNLVTHIVENILPGVLSESATTQDFDDPENTYERAVYDVTLDGEDVAAFREHLGARLWSAWQESLADV